MAWTKIKIAIAGIAIAGAAAYMVIQHAVEGRLRGQNEALMRQIAELQGDNEKLSERTANIVLRKLRQNLAYPWRQKPVALPAQPQRGEITKPRPTAWVKISPRFYSQP